MDRNDLALQIVNKDIVFGPVKTWSFSALSVFETCPQKISLSKIAKIPEPQHPAAARGTAIHQMAEDYVRGKYAELPKELSKFPVGMKLLKDTYENTPDMIEMEGDWGFDLGWQPTNYYGADVWCRVKCDVVLHEDATSLRVIDYKTGKSWGNEIKHAQQLMLYAIATFEKYPEIEHVSSELWYLDEGKTLEKNYIRTVAKEFRKGWHNRALRMTTATEFDANPSKANCRFCTYRKTGDCEWAVD